MTTDNRPGDARSEMPGVCASRTKKFKHADQMLWVLSVGKGPGCIVTTLSRFIGSTAQVLGFLGDPVGKATSAGPDPGVAAG